MYIKLKFAEQDASVGAFILPITNTSLNVAIVSSTVPVNEITTDKNSVFTYSASEPGEQQIRWPVEYGKPKIKSAQKFDFKIREKSKNYIVEIVMKEKKTKIILEKN